MASLKRSHYNRMVDFRLRPFKFTSDHGKREFDSSPSIFARPLVAGIGQALYLWLQRGRTKQHSKGLTPDHHGFIFREVRGKFVVLVTF